MLTVAAEWGSSCIIWIQGKKVHIRRFRSTLWNVRYIVHIFSSCRQFWNLNFKFIFCRFVQWCTAVQLSVSLHYIILHYFFVSLHSNSTKLIVKKKIAVPCCKRNFFLTLAMTLRWLTKCVFVFQDQYEFIYRALREYLDSFDAYSNFEADQYWD